MRHAPRFAQAQVMALPRPATAGREREWLVAAVALAILLAGLLAS